MDITFSAISDNATFVLPISFLFWGYVAAYVMHILEESLMGETFVGMIRKSFLPDYEWKHFAGFNTLLMLLIILSIVVYEIGGEAWSVLPLTFVFLMVTNGLWHLGATLITKRYSPGLLTSILYWVLFYFIFRYAFLKGEVPVLPFIVAALLGTAITVAMIGSLFVFRKKFGAAIKHRDATAIQ